MNFDFYDIPGGKIEENETNEEASIREFKEETGGEILKQEYIGHVIIEYPDKIFDFDIFKVQNYELKKVNLDETESMFISISELLSKEKKFPSIEILKYLDHLPLELKIITDENHQIKNVIRY